MNGTGDLRSNNETISNTVREETRNNDDEDNIDNLSIRSNAGISVGEAAVHLVRGNLGPGALSLPYAYARAGWASGTVLLLAVIAQAVYSMDLLAYIENELVSDIERNGNLDENTSSTDAVTNDEDADDVTSRRLDLGEVVERCINTGAKRTVNFFLFVSQGGVCCVYISLVSENMASLITSWNAKRNIYILLLFPLFALISLLNKVRDMKIVSHFGNFGMISVVVVAAIAGIVELANRENGGEYALEAAKPQGAPNFFAAVKDLVLIASTSFYSFEGLGLVLPVANAMAQPQKFPKALLRSTIVLVSCFILLGVTCGIAYHDRLDSGSITAFLADDARDQNAQGWKIAVFDALNALVTLSVTLTFPLQLFPAAEVFEQWCRSAFSWASNFRLFSQSDIDTSTPLPNNPDLLETQQDYVFLAGDNQTSAGTRTKCSHIGKYGWVLRRVVLVAIYSLLTLTVPNVGLIVALVGSIGFTALAATPLVCKVSLSLKRNLPISPLDIGIITFCAFLMIFGTVFAIKDIIDS